VKDVKPVKGKMPQKHRNTEFLRKHHSTIPCFFAQLKKTKTDFPLLSVFL